VASIEEVKFGGNGVGYISRLGVLLIYELIMADLSWWETVNVYVTLSMKRTSGEVRSIEHMHKTFSRTCYTTLQFDSRPHIS
jgi:hypothetical protein